MDTLKGLCMSASAWFGAFIVAWPDIASVIGDNLTALLGANANNNIMRIMGIIVILLRLKTTQPVAEKVK
jgi:kynureninase